LWGSWISGGQKEDRYNKSLLFKYFKAIKSKGYHPILINGEIFDGDRDPSERWESVKCELVRYNAKNLLDIGCGEGWFLRRAADELGCFSFGIDGDNKRIIPSEIARLHDDVERVCIMRANLDEKIINELPQFDVVLCLSVIHHVIIYEGMEKAVEFMKSVVNRARKAVIFETGTSDEKAMWWADDLPDMPSGQEAFIRSFLSDAGLVGIRQIGWASSYRKDAKRYLFVGEPDLAER
jgi:SAM-dependent methyltransferase